MRALAIALLCLVASVGTTQAQEDYPFVAEEYPPHLAYRIAEQDAALQVASVNFGDQYFLAPLKIWQAGSTLRVCFFSGSQATRASIARAASAWNNQAAIALDFGDMANPRLCMSGQQNEIRVGFAYRGYWSLVGTDSITQAGPNEQSMNFTLFDVNPPGNPRFTQVVLHEFGHALGFKHEHQIYHAPCASEFDWPAIYAYLKGDPNYWDEETIDRNMRPLSQSQSSGAKPDMDSIMLYGFPPKFYKTGTSAECYTPGNTVLSNGDIAGLRKYYPASPAEAQAVRAEVLADYQAQVDVLPLSAIERNAAKLRASTLLQPEAFVALPTDSFVLDNFDASVMEQLVQVRPMLQ